MGLQAAHHDRLVDLLADQPQPLFAMEPLAASVPVTTVPAPATLKARSTQVRTGPSAAGGRAAASTLSRAVRSSSSPAPVAAETTTA